MGDEFDNEFDDEERLTSPDTPSALRATSATLDSLESAGHEMTHIAGPLAGISWYWCEGCGSIASVNQDGLDIFQGAGPHANEAFCPWPLTPGSAPRAVLKNKIATKNLEWFRRRMKEDKG